MIISFEITPFDSPNKKAYFKVVGREGVYQVIIKIENGEAVFDPASCDCKFGSFWGQTKENKKNGKICVHLSECLTFLEDQAWISERKNKELIKNG